MRIEEDVGWRRRDVETAILVAGRKAYLVSLGMHLPSTRWSYSTPGLWEFIMTFAASSQFHFTTTRNRRVQDCTAPVMYSSQTWYHVGGVAGTGNLQSSLMKSDDDEQLRIYLKGYLTTECRLLVENV